MSRRIDIELTSALGDGTWTWRAAGAKQPKGVVDGALFPSGAAVGDEFRVEAEQELDGITILSVVPGREKQTRALVELLPVEKDFKPVLETRAPGGRGGRDGSRDGGRGRRDDRGERGDRRSRGDAPRGDRERPAGDRGPRPDGSRGDAPRGDGRRSDGPRRDGAGGGGRRPGGERRGPSFTPPPELPQRPKPKRLRPGKANRAALLADIPEAQRQIAELALQGMGAVRQRVREENERAAAEGRPPMPEASVVKLAEDLLPKLRVAEWLDRAEAAQRQMEHLDLRDLRSVVVAAGDPMVARDESTRALAAEMRAALVTKQEQELVLWFGDVDAALAVGRVIRALRLSSQPPKAGVPFPVDIAQRLIDSVNASLAPMDAPDRWAAMLEAAAFSPIREKIAPVRKPDVVSDELLATVKRLAPALPQIAAMFDVEVDPKAPMPKPLRAGPPRKGPEGDKAARGSRREGGGREGGGREGGKGAGRDRAGKAPAAVRDTPSAEPTDEADAPAVAPEMVETSAADTPHVDTEVTEAEVVDAEAADTEVADTEAAETEVADTEAVETEVAEAELAEASAVQSEATDTEAADTEAAETEVADAAAVETEVAEAEVAETSAVQSEATDTEAADTEAEENALVGTGDAPMPGGETNDVASAETTSESATGPEHGSNAELPTSTDTVGAVTGETPANDEEAALDAAATESDADDKS
jgi:hypothetical protein